MIPGIAFEGIYFYTYGDFLKLSEVATNDLDIALESLGKMPGPWRRFIKDKEAVKEYANVEINGITVKRILLAKAYNSGRTKICIGYIIPHHKTTALFVQEPMILPEAEAAIQTLDEVLKYMVATTVFREL